MGLPVQTPVEADNGCPLTGLPLITGRLVFAGGCGEVTTAVWADTAVVLPAALLAVTATRSVDPTSAAASV